MESPDRESTPTEQPEIDEIAERAASEIQEEDPSEAPHQELRGSEDEEAPSIDEAAEIVASELSDEEASVEAASEDDEDIGEEDPEQAVPRSAQGEPGYGFNGLEGRNGPNTASHEEGEEEEPEEEDPDETPGSEAAPQTIRIVRHRRLLGRHQYNHELVEHIEKHLTYTVNRNRAIIASPPRLAEVSDHALRERLADGRWLREPTYTKLELTNRGGPRVIYRRLTRAVTPDGRDTIQITLGSSGLEPGDTVRIARASLITPDTFLHDLQARLPGGIRVGEARIVPGEGGIIIQGPGWEQHCGVQGSSFAEDFSRNRLGLRFTLGTPPASADIVLYHDGEGRAEAYLDEGTKNRPLEDIRLEGGRLQLTYRKGPTELRTRYIVIQPRRRTPLEKPVWSDGRIGISPDELRGMLPREEWPEVDRLLAGEKPSMKPYTFTIEAGGRQHTIVRGLPRPGPRGWFRFNIEPVPAKPGDSIRIISIEPTTLQQLADKPIRSGETEIWISSDGALHIRGRGGHHTLTPDELQLIYSDVHLTAGARIQLGEDTLILYPEKGIAQLSIGGRHNKPIRDMRYEGGVLYVTYEIPAGRRTHRIRPGWKVEGQISDTKVWIAEGEGFRFAEVILGKEDRKRFFEGSTQERGDVGERVIAQCFRLVFGDRATPLKTAKGKPNLGISDVEISIDGKLYPTEVKARTYEGPGTPLSIEAARRTLFNAMKGLARHFNLEQYREAGRGFIGLVLIRPDEGTGEVALISVDRRDQSHMEVMLGRPWITKFLDMWNKPEESSNG